MGDTKIFEITLNKDWEQARKFTIHTGVKGNEMFNNAIEKYIISSRCWAIAPCFSNKTINNMNMKPKLVDLIEDFIYEWEN